MSYLGIDCGTSAIKAVLVDDEEQTLAAAEAAYSPSHPQPGWSEQDPREWRAAMFAALAKLRAAAPAAFGATRALGFSGQMHSAVLLGADDRPVRPAILHNDQRAHAEAKALAANHPELPRIVGVKPMAGFTAPKLLWLARYEPHTFARVRCVLLPKDYLRFELTGEKLIDMSDAAGTWWLDEARRRWSEAALAASGISDAYVPELVEASERAASLTPEIADELGLPRGLAVAAGGGDSPVGAVGLGAIRPGEAFISLGTAAQLIVASDVYRAAPEKLVHSFAHALPGRWYRMAAMLNGAAPLAFAARFLKTPIDHLESEAAENYQGPGDLTFLPYLIGERTPLDDPYARGVAFGFSYGTTRADFVRAVMEGVALTFAEARDCLEAAGDTIGDVGFSGGGARSVLWARMIAAAIQRRILHYAGATTGPAYGAARLARIAATGERPETVCKRPTISAVTEPDPRLVEAFAAKRIRFQALYRALKAEFAAAAN